MERTCECPKSLVPQGDFLRGVGQGVRSAVWPSQTPRRKSPWGTSDDRRRNTAGNARSPVWKNAFVGPAQARCQREQTLAGVGQGGDIFTSPAVTTFLWSTQIARYPPTYLQTNGSIGAKPGYRCAISARIAPPTGKHVATRRFSCTPGFPSPVPAPFAIRRGRRID
jgi:hypothetical protein